MSWTQQEKERLFTSLLGLAALLATLVDEVELIRARAKRSAPSKRGGR